jgi:anaerobic sulfite reductase subunit C
MKESEIKGFRVETCFGGLKCPNRAIETEPLVERIIRLLETENLPAFLQAQIQAPIKHHHEFRVAVSDCPNACSQPQIKDIGIIGAILPKVADVSCTACGACSLDCIEHAITVDTKTKKPVIDFKLCVKCGQCVKSCPTHTLAVGEKGFRIQVGGKLGRRPQLASEIPGIYHEDEIISLVGECISFYKKHGKNGQRFGSIIARSGLDEIINPLKRGNSHEKEFS